MGRPSLTSIVCVCFTVYMAHTMWSVAKLFTSLQCTGMPCYTSYLATKPQLQLVLFTSSNFNPSSNDVREVETISPFDYSLPLERDIKIKITQRTRKNGTLYLYAVLALDNGTLEWDSLKRDGPTVIQRISLVDFIPPKADTFNLLGKSKGATSSKSEKNILKPVGHFKPKIYISVLVDNISMSADDIPPEFRRFIRITKKNEFLPIIQNDFLKIRLNELVEITPATTSMPLKFYYSPIGIGKLRLMLHVEQAMLSMETLGLNQKDIDEIKGIFSDTNIYLLCGTIIITSVHMVFDFLSFKNDVAFWKRKTSYEGLSTRTTLWRGISQIIIFLFLLDERSSLLILVPSIIGTLIELWKCKKILKIEITMTGLKFKSSALNKKSEEETKALDREAMQYLSYLLYPLCMGGAIYSLFYQPHKSWYSWTINSLVNGVYAFGFLFMLPQLFVNYKLKSVAALPWRAFMYKAFNTFIDDIFAFIITMPTAHRLACFRDDIVFMIYLYQRWLYPVDSTRIDDGTAISEIVDNENVATLQEKTKEKKQN